MKNSVKSLLVVATMGLLSTTVSAATFATQDTIIKDTLKKEVPTQMICMAADDVTYTKVETADVPQAVKSAATEKYAAYVIDEAFKGSDNSFKLILKKEEAKLTVYYNEAGEFQKEETAPPVQSV